METHLQVAAQLKNQMIMRCVLGSWRTDLETPGHPQMQDHNALRVQADEQVFRPAVDGLDPTTHGLLVQRLNVDQIAQLRLPYAHPGNVLADDLGCEPAPDGFDFW